MRARYTHAAVKGWSQLCQKVRPRFIGPVLSGGWQGRHSDEDLGGCSTQRKEINCPVCLVILDAIEERGIHLKMDRSWRALRSDGVYGHASKKSLFKNRPGARFTYGEPEPEAFINSRSLNHYVEELRKALGWA